MAGIFPTIDLIATGKRIRELRIRASMTVEGLARAVGVSKNAVVKWQSGANLPAVENLIQLSWLWGIGIEEILVVRDGPLIWPGRFSDDPG